jgi:exopolysaccharide production protein ExoZ
LNFIVLLRAIAVSLVLLHHYFGLGAIKGILKPFRALIENGNAGVLIFFLISGFVIALSFEKQKPLEFIVRRVLRIWPILIVASFFFQFYLVFRNGILLK